MRLYNDKIMTEIMLEKEKFDVTPLDNERIVSQIRKTGNTIFNIKDIEIEAQELKMPVSKLNNLRREAIEKFENCLENSIKRQCQTDTNIEFESKVNRQFSEPKVNLFLQKFNKNINYETLDYSEIYVAFKDLTNGVKLRKCIPVLPNIIDEKYEKLILENLEILQNAEKIMISHISQIGLLQRLNLDKKIVADYTLNITNNISEKVAKILGIERFAMSPELDKNGINNLGDEIEKEFVVYGRTCLMTSKYCPIGKNANCKLACKNGDYELKDRKDFLFPVVSDCTNCHSRIYNSKILSIDYKNMGIDFVRVDVLNESQEEIKKIISTVKNKGTFAGKEYTHGNF